MAGKADFLETTRFTNYTNLITGLWSINVDKIIGSSNVKRALKIYAIISNVLVVLNGISATIRVASSGVPVAERFIGFLTTATILQASAKCSYMVLRREKFQRLCDAWDKSFLNAPFKRHEQLLNAVERRKVKIVTIGMLLVFAGPAVPWCLMPFVPAVQDMHGGKFFAVPLWMPFDIYKSPANEILLGIQALNAWFIVSKMVSFDCFFFTFVSLVFVQLKHLRFTMGKIFEEEGPDVATDLIDSPADTSIEFVPEKKGDTSNQIVIGVDTNSFAKRLAESRTKISSKNDKNTEYEREKKSSERQRNLIKTRLALWVKHHQEVLNLGDLIKELYFPMTMIQYMSTILMLCFTAFIITSVHLATIQTVICTIFCGSVIIQMYLLCNFGDRLASESVALANACFESGWHNHNIKEVQSSMQIIIMRAQKPMRITFFGLFPLNSETFADVIQSAISYLMVLLKLNEN